MYIVILANYCFLRKVIVTALVVDRNNKVTVSL